MLELLVGDLLSALASAFTGVKIDQVPICVSDLIGSLSLYRLVDDGQVARDGFIDHHGDC